MMLDAYACRVRAAIPLLFALGASAQPSHGQESLDAARTALRTGRYDAAITAFKRAVRQEPLSAEATRGLVRGLREVGRYGEAEAAARRYIAAAPNSPELWNILGEVLYLGGRIEEAEKAFRRASDGGAADALDARFNLAVMWYERGERAAAMAEFDRFIDVYNGSSGLSAEELTAEELTAVAGAVRYLGAENPQLYKDALRALDEAIALDPGELEPRLQVAELFLEKYNGTDAADAFRDVLQVNPSHPRALLGMARLKRFEGSGEALEYVERSLAVNPDFVPARALLASLRLESEEYREADAEAKRALKVNPKSLEALSVLATTRFMSGDEAGFAEVVSRVEQLNPSYAELYVTLAELSARNRLYPAAVDFAGRAVELDEKSWRGRALLGVNQLRVGAIEDGRRNLEIAFEGDPYDVWTKNTLDLLDTFEDYSEIRSDRFTVVIDGKESALLSLYLAEIAEEAYDRLAERYGYRPPTPLRLEVLRSHADFSVRTIGLVGLPALGVSFGSVIVMDSPSAREPGAFNWGSTLWHELAHTFHIGMSDYRVPRWFSEGLAVYEERRARRGWGDDVTPGFLSAHIQGRLLPLAELNNGFTRPTYPQQVVHSYYQASLVCEFIEAERGAEALVDMLAAFKRGLDTKAAFAVVLDSDVDEYSDRFFSYLEERFRGPLGALRASSSEEHGSLSRGELERRAREEEGDFVAQLTFGRLLYGEERLDEAATFLRRAKELFPEFAGQGSPYWYLALIHRRQGLLEGAEQELAALTAINERDYDALMELAAIREELGDRRGAASALDRAIYIFPFEVELHLRLAELYSAIGEGAGAVRERRAVLALDPVDRAEALYQLALAYFEAGDLVNARRTVLRALEDAPSFDKAQDLLLELHGVSGGA